MGDLIFSDSPAHNNDNDDPLSTAYGMTLESDIPLSIINGEQHNAQEKQRTEEEIRIANAYFASFICGEIRARFKRADIHRDDFLYEMFATVIFPNGPDGVGYKVWWMSVGHPVADFLHDNFQAHRTFPPIVMYRTQFGDVIIYHDETVQDAIDGIVILCEEHGETIILPREDGDIKEEEEEQEQEEQEELMEEVNLEEEEQEQEIENQPPPVLFPLKPKSAQAKKAE